MHSKAHGKSDMTAEQARQLTIKYIEGPDIEALVRVIDQRIAEAAKHGQSQIASPDIGHLRDGVIYHLGADERRALRRHYDERGFFWRDHPKVGHPCCRDYSTLSW